jgi:EmrB/QacA subfamily drug resistance transporter
MEMEMAPVSEKASGAQSFQTLPKRQLVWTIIGLQLTLLLAALDGTIVGTAMPSIIGQLQGFDRYAWVTTAYMLTSTIAVPIFGKLSDIYGRKWIFLGGAISFVIASALCGAAGYLPLPIDGMNQLILFRGLQGLASGVILGLTFTVVGDLFPPSERGKYQGLFAAVWGLSSVFGPTLGGWLTDGPGWRWVFYVNLPVGILAISVLWVAFPNIKPQGVRRVIDWLGAGTLIACLVPLLLALTWVTDYGWTSPRVLGLLALSAIMLPAFIFSESRAIEPLMPLSLFKNSIVALSSVSLLITGLGMFGAILFLPLFMQSVIGVSATRSGSLLTPMMLMVSFGSIASGQIVSRMGRYKWLAIFGMAMMACGMALMAGMGTDTTQAITVRNMIIVGAGLGLVMPLYTLIVQNAVPQSQLGVATASTQFFRSIGGTLGAAIFGSIMLSRYRENFDASLPQGVPAALQEPFRNPLQLAQIRSQLEAAFAQVPNGQGQALLDHLFLNVRDSLVYALNGVFLIAAIVVAAAGVLNFALREIPLRKTFESAVAPTAVKPAEQPAEQAVPVPVLAGVGEGDD